MMKIFKNAILAVVAVLGMQTANAQAKTAHVDVNDITTKMPAMIEARKQLEKITENYSKEYKTLVEEYQAKGKKYEAEAASVSDAVNQTRQQEMQDMGKRISDFQENAQADIQKKEGDLMKPLVEKIKASIAKVGKAKGYQYVLDVSSLLLADGPDITVDVKKDLGF